MEIDGDEKLSDLEKKVKLVNDMIEDKELQNREMFLKVVKLEKDFEKVR